MEEKLGKIVEVIKKQIGEKMLEEQKKSKDTKRFFVSDSHFCDERLNLYSRDLLFKNAKEVDECIIERWNKTVGTNDLVYHLGDVSMTKEGLELLNRCNGKKILIKGNYDTPTEEGGTAKYEISDKILLKYFDEVHDDLELEIGGETVYLNHFPTNAREDMFNICGHIHNTVRVGRNFFNVGLDANHFTPINEELVKFQINGIKNFYDQNVFSGELKANINNRRGEVIVLRAPEEYKVSNFEENKDVFVFIAGPIDGTNSEKMWQEIIMLKIQNGLKDVKINKNVVLCSPRRLENPEDFVYEEQVDWESKFLNKSANQGIVVFCFAKEMKKIEGRSFARTTRIEFGEWIAKGKKIDNFKLVVGYEKGFDGIEYIHKKLQDMYPEVKLKENIDEMVEEVVKLIKKMI